MSKYKVGDKVSYTRGWGKHKGNVVELVPTAYVGQRYKVISNISGQDDVFDEMDLELIEDEKVITPKCECGWGMFPQYVAIHPHSDWCPIKKESQQ